MKRYSKPLGNLLDFKQEYFESNDSKLKEFNKIATIYRSQPRRTNCKNCAHPLVFDSSQAFVTHGVEHWFCSRCGHCNGAYEDTDAYCRALYTDDQGENYARHYSSADVQQYKDRVAAIYSPKAQFLKAALEEAGVKSPVRLTDFGAGAGYFVSAAMECGFVDVTGYEPSKTLVKHGNEMIGSERLTQHDLSEIIPLIETCEATVASFIGVFEHLQTPRAALQALRLNPQIRYVFFSVPLFSPTAVIESAFPTVLPRHLVGTHTHLYTEESIQFFCEEFGFERLSEWWFGLDMTDLSRCVLVSSKMENSVLRTYWTQHFMPLIDKLQSILDENQCSSEVHMLLGKKE